MSRSKTRCVSVSDFKSCHMTQFASFGTDTNRKCRRFLLFMTSLHIVVPVVSRLRMSSLLKVDVSPPISLSVPAFWRASTCRNHVNTFACCSCCYNATRCCNTNLGERKGVDPGLELKL